MEFQLRQSLGGLKRTAGWRLLRGVKRKLLPPTLPHRPVREWKGELTAFDPPVALEAGRTSDWRVRVTNSGPNAFPAGAVAVEAQWISRHGSVIGGRITHLLTCPVFSGESAEISVSVPAPDPVGDFQLTLRLAVAGQVFGNSVTVSVPVVGRRETDINYHAVYRTANLSENHWWVVGAYQSREVYDRSKRERREMLTRYGLTPDSRVLDVGCGTGQMADALEEYLSPSGAYFGTDIGAEAIAYCLKHFQRPNYVFRKGGMTTLPFVPADGPFDVAIFFSVFTHTFVDESALLLAETRRLLSSTGTVIADVITSDLCERGSGHRGEMVVNREYFLRLAGAVGFAAEEMGRWDWNPHAVRIMYALRPV